MKKDARLSRGRGGFSQEGTMNRISMVLLGGSFDAEALEDAKRSSFVTVDNPVRQYSSFFLRLVAAAVIATAGIAENSTAAVIGAMLVAPLMSPMLGTTLAATLGRPGDAVRALIQTIVGMAVAVASAVVVTAIIPVAVDMNTNPQVLSRTAPRLVDLIIALASGFIAALASMRRDIPDAVPGIAISASIVPPLCVVGAALYERAFDAAAGAFLLFFTNFVAIQVMGAAVFLLMGLGAKRHSAIEGRRRRAWFASLAVVTVVVFALLANASLNVVRQNVQMRQAQTTVSSWVENSGYRVSSFSLSNGALQVEIAGEGAVPSIEQLDSDLADAGVQVKSLAVAKVDEQRIES